jgi:AcrR family transcriptional regulator
MSRSASVRALRRDDPEGPTRERLMREALQLLGREGLNGVSLRRIVAASGGSNPSALHYHIGNRGDLVRELAQMLQAWLEPRCLERLEKLKTRTRYSVRDVLGAVFGPVLEMLKDPAYGRDAIRFIARLGWEFGPQGQELSARLHAKSLNGALALLKPLLPGVRDETLKFRLVLNMANVYHGLADRSYLWHSPFGPLDLARPENGARLEKLFMDYLEAGLRNDGQK